MNSIRQRNLHELNSERVRTINKKIKLFNHHVTRYYEAMCDEDLRARLFNLKKLIDLANDELDSLTNIDNKQE